MDKNRRKTEKIKNAEDIIGNNIMVLIITLYFIFLYLTYKNHSSVYFITMQVIYILGSAVNFYYIFNHIMDKNGKKYSTALINEIFILFINVLYLSIYYSVLYSFIFNLLVTSALSWGTFFIFWREKQKN